MSVREGERERERDAGKVPSRHQPAVVATGGHRNAPHHDNTANTLNPRASPPLHTAHLPTASQDLISPAPDMAPSATEPPAAPLGARAEKTYPPARIFPVKETRFEKHTPPQPDGREKASEKPAGSAAIVIDNGASSQPRPRRQEPADCSTRRRLQRSSRMVLRGATAVLHPAHHGQIQRPQAGQDIFLCRHRLLRRHDRARPYS